jgi:hypothetical protein
MATRDLPTPPLIATGARARNDRRGTTVSGLRRQDDTPPARAAAAPRRPPPGELALSIKRRGALIELGLSGELNLATAPRIGEAMAWLRFSGGPGTTILIDTSDVDFISAAGYRAIQAALVGRNGLWDPCVALIVGPAVARLEVAISGASAARSRQVQPMVSAVRDPDRP